MTRITMESGTEINVSSDYEVVFSESEKFLHIFVRDLKDPTLEDKEYRSRWINTKHIYSIECNIPG